MHSGYSQQLCKDQALQTIITEPIDCNENPYVLVFEDNFEQSEVNESIWSIFEGVPRDFDFIDQKAWHQKENVRIENGKLKITAEKLAEPISRSWVTNWSTDPFTTKTSNFDYTTGEIWSKQKFSHGKFEIRCKIPKGKGFFPAFWTFSGHPWNEIDIFEFWNERTFGQFDPNKLSRYHKMNLHYDNNDDGQTDNCPSKYRGPDFSTSFHVFSIVWTPYKIEWYVDGELKRISTLYYSLNGQMVDCSSLRLLEPYLLNTAFPKNPMHIIANLAIQSDDQSPDSNTPFPSFLEIDYIRYYKQMETPCKDECIEINSFEEIQSENNEYLSVISRCIHLKNGFELTHGQQLNLIASDTIIIDENILIEDGAIFDFEVNPNTCLNNIPPLKDIEIFPNPTSDKVIVTVTLSSNEFNLLDFTYDLVASNGKIIKPSSSLSQLQFEVKLKSLASGSYHLNLYYKGYPIASKVIFKE